ncbi:unnamed protein product [Mytilus coruscus]|uniref:Uncharacterized protein n=1 Tax=Mytilus coruscus TaxID=42192 RepID=A0A6J8CRZ4_MYTCO|nr:unnamed protein product [Mytilus coruscus]
MKNNLIFSGLGFQADEQCEEKIQNFVQIELGINYKISFGNVHCFGKKGKNGVRPIVSRFVYRREMEHVLRQTYILKGKPFGICEQFPPEIENRRKELYPIMKDARKSGKKVNLVRDKLYINGKLYLTTPTPPKQSGEYRDVLLAKLPTPSEQYPPVPPRPYKRPCSRLDSTDSDNSSTQLFNTKL